MELIRGLHNLKPRHQGCVATIGNFDGVHLGHVKVLSQVRAAAERLCCPTLAIIFEPQPREFFDIASAPPRITRLRDKVRYLQEAGIDAVLCLPFNDKLRSLPALAFVNAVLLEGLRVRHFVVGDDFRFGCDRAGDFTLLQQIGTACGFVVENTHTFSLHGARVSSSRIRELLAEAQLARAEKMLGRSYAISGRVEYGQQLGRTIGVPTANISLRGKQPALRGVFAVEVLGLGDLPMPAVANIGMRPTVKGIKPNLEVHLLDYSGNLYGQHIDVVFRHYIRAEQRFPDLQALTTQIHLDIAHARNWFERREAADETYSA
ncbi:bifunctional riboflavin kinase/FAD synthetase [Pokkaliibacter plantistimulans]|uniref:Riboflavin biosynthesis protein n=1 Tax=Proteobacteria bacterium 228 TaxID=2083153 RepID=A0A2S5KXY7_9PROT|nr:bifunctional riboflavin kinase/FAD synthetase [Pokkaliibacter plantistimulans]PPC79136.1 bifunctional riboflavin kinase/FAD synthetase [Pokkaliibacter plantistimulans]